MNLALAGLGVMFDTYDDLRDRILSKHKKVCELRSYWEWRFFTGHTPHIYGKPFMLDSGAYTAYSKQTFIDLDNYAKFCLKHRDKIDYYINLDAIPKSDSEAHRREAAEQTWKNQLELESYGLTPLPVFHKGEPEEFLERYIDKYDYICLGGLVADSVLTNEEFFERVWDQYLTKADGTPKVRVHAFGMTSRPNMFAYPWFSVDSTTWLVHAKIGQIDIPRKINGRYDYNVKPHTIMVSDKSTAKQFYGQHLDTLPESTREMMAEYLATRDMTLEQVSTHAVWRFAANMDYWIGVQDFATFPTHFKKREVDLL